MEPPGSNIQDEPPPLQRTVTNAAPLNVFAPKDLSLPKLFEAIRALDAQKVGDMITQKPTILDKATGKPKDPKIVYNICPLLTAVMTGNEDMVRIIANSTKQNGFLNRLNTHTAKIYVPETDDASETAELLGTNPLLYAAFKGDTAVCSALLEIPEVLATKRNDRNNSVLDLLVVKPGMLDTIKQVVSRNEFMKGIPYKHIVKTLLSLFTQTFPDRNSYAEAIINMLESSDDMLKRRHYTVRALQKPTIDIINYGVFNGTVQKEVDVFLPAGVEPPAKLNRTLFMWMALNNTIDKDAYAMFISRVPFMPITYADTEGNTLLHYLAVNRQNPNAADIIRYLKKTNKYAPFVLNHTGEIPIMVAIKTDNMEVVKEMIDDVINYVNPVSGNTVFMDAAIMGKAEFFKLLIGKQVGDVLQLKNKNGQTAFDLVPASDILTRNVLKQLNTYDISAVGSMMTTLKNMMRDPVTYTLCPVCLEIKVMTEGCNFASHTCLAQRRHEELYQKYKNKDVDQLGWCKICGRVSADEWVMLDDGKLHPVRHGHVQYQEPNSTEPLKVDNDPYPYGRKDAEGKREDYGCLQANGGGFTEKMARFHALYNALCKLQGDILAGKAIDQRTAQNQLIEDVWRGSQVPSPLFTQVMEHFYPEGRAERENMNKLKAEHPVLNEVQMQQRSFTPEQRRKNKENSDFLFQESKKLPSEEDIEKKIDEYMASINASFPCVFKKLSEEDVTAKAKEEAAEYEQQKQAIINLAKQKAAEGLYGLEAGEQVIPPIVTENHVCEPNLGPHEDNRPTYVFKHIQPGQQNANIGNPDTFTHGAICMAEVVVAIEQQPEKEFAIGIKCPLSNDCKGFLYPQEINDIDSGEFFLPTDYTPGIEDPEERKAKGDEFKKMYNERFILNRMMKKLEQQPQQGGANQSDIAFFNNLLVKDVTEATDYCPLPPPAQKARGGIKTFRRRNRTSTVRRSRTAF